MFLIIIKKEYNAIEVLFFNKIKNNINKALTDMYLAITTGNIFDFYI